MKKIYSSGSLFNMNLKSTICIIIISLDSCGDSSVKESSLTDDINIANNFLDAFYSFNRDSLESVDDKVIIENIGGLPVPVSLKITISDKSETEIRKTAEIWKNAGSIIYIPIKEEKKIEKFILSDDYLIPDVDRTNKIYFYK